MKGKGRERKGREEKGKERKGRGVREPSSGPHVCCPALMVAAIETELFH